MADCALTLDILDPEDNPVTNGALGIAPATTTITGEGVMVADEQFYELSDPFNVVTLVRGAMYRFREYKPKGRTFYATIPNTATADYSDLSPLVPIPPGPDLTYTAGEVDERLELKQDRPTLGGGNVVVYGDSLTDDDMAPFLGPITTAQMYYRQFGAALDAGTVTTYGVAGCRINHALGSMLAAGTWPGLPAPKAGAVWPGVSNRGGVGVIDTLHNDIGHYATIGGGTPAAITGAGGDRYIAGIAGLWEAALAVRSSESRLEFHDGATGVTASGGTWPAGNVAFTYLSGGQESFTITPGDWRQISIPANKIPQGGPLAGRVYVGMQQHDPSVVTPSAISVSVDGGTAWTWTPPGWEAYGTATESYAVIPVDLPVDGAAHTVRVTHAGSAGHMMAVDTVILPSSTPPDIYVMQAYDIIVSPIFTAGQVAIWKANKALIEPAVRAVVAKFPNAVWVPTTVTTAGIYAPDGIHPNLTGMIRRAADLVRAFSARWFGADAGIQSGVAALAAETARAQAAEGLLAPKASPTLTGTTTADMMVYNRLTEVPATQTATAVLTITSNKVQLCNATSGAISITPTATTTPGVVYLIKKTDSSVNPVTVVGTIDGQTNVVLDSQYDYVEIVTTAVSGTFLLIRTNVASASLQTPKWLNSRYYESQYVGFNIANNTLTAGTVYYVPITIPRGTTITEVAINVTTAVAATAIHIGLYANGAGGPGALIRNFGNVASTSSGNKSLTALAQPVAGGMYWLGLMALGGAPGISCHAGANAGVSAWIGAGAIAETQRAGWNQTGQASLPATPSSLVTSTDARPRIQVKPA